MAEFLHQKERCARKTHQCDLCDGEIHPGESYIYTACIEGGSVYDFKMHLHCAALTERYCMAMDMDEYCTEAVECWAQEEVCSECDKWADACEYKYTALTCPKVLKALLPPTLLGHKDTRRYVETEKKRYEKDKD